MEDTEYKLVRISKQTTNNEYIITIIKDNRVMQVRLKERKVTLEKYIKNVEVFEGAHREVEVRVMGIMRFMTVEIIMTDVENIKDQLQHVQVRTEVIRSFACFTLCKLYTCFLGTEINVNSVSSFSLCRVSRKKS